MTALDPDVEPVSDSARDGWVGDPTDPMDCADCCARQTLCPAHIRKMRSDARDALAALVLIDATRGNELGAWWELAKRHGVVTT